MSSDREAEWRTYEQRVFAAAGALAAGRSVEELRERAEELRDLAPAIHRELVLTEIAVAIAEGRQPNAYWTMQPGIVCEVWRGGE